MKKSKIIILVCILLAITCCFVACNNGANNAKSLEITATLTHADGVLLQKIESTFTKEDKNYSFITKTTSLNSLDSGKADMYSTEEKSGFDAQIFLPSWELDDFADVFEMSESRLYGKLTAEKVAELGITDATDDVIVDVAMNQDQVVSLSIRYTNTSLATVTILATITY